MKAAASPRSMAQVVAVLAFVISHTTFLAAQDDETGDARRLYEMTLFSYRSLPPLGEGAPKGRIGHRRHMWRKREFLTANDNDLISVS